MDAGVGEEPQYSCQTPGGPLLCRAQPEGDCGGRVGLLSVPVLTPCCPGAGQTGSQSLPHRRTLFARVEGRNCLGGELQANFRLGDSQAAGWDN